MPEDASLSELLAALEPELLPGEFVYVSLPNGSITSACRATVIEPEGISAVMFQSDAEEEGLEYDSTFSWITLKVFSSLTSVGLTAAVSTVLAEAGISCNVIAGYHHDHLLVPVERAEEAVAILLSLSDS